MTPVPERLPRGRHGLTREEVAGSQRARMLRAMADALMEKGFAGTSVRDVLVRAGVSRETFYQHFTSKQHCFEEVFDAAAEAVLAALADGGPVLGSPVERFDVLLGRYLDALAGEPALARVVLVEVYAAGPNALERRARIQRRFVDVVASILGASDTRARFACEALVAAISSMVTARLVANDPKGVKALRRPLVELVRYAVGS